MRRQSLDIDKDQFNRNKKLLQQIKIKKAQSMGIAKLKPSKEKSGSTSKDAGQQHQQSSNDKAPQEEPNHEFDNDEMDNESQRFSTDSLDEDEDDYRNELTDSQQVNDEKQEDTQNEVKKQSNIKRKQGHQSTSQMIQQQLQDNDQEDLYEEQIIRLKNLQYDKWIMNPESNTRTAIDGCSFIFLLVIALYVPFMISFDINPAEWFQVIEVFIDIWFMIEIFVNFFTGYYNKGILVMHLPSIACNYVRGYLWIDVISSFPLSFISIAISHEANATAIQSAKFLRMIRLTRYLRLLRLIRFVQVDRLISAFEIFLVSEMAHLSMKFLKISVVVVFTAHWIACVLYSVTQFDDPNEPTNWIKTNQLQDASVSEIYVNALYWVITTTCTVGYGDFHPVTTNERIVVIACMILQSGMFAYIIGDISRTVAGFNRLATHFRERMNYVEQFLREKDIPVQLRQQVKRYLEYNWELKKLYKIEETELLSLLNDNLRGKIIVYFNGRILQSIDVLGRFPIEFLSNLSFILQKRVYAIDDDCVIEGDLGQEIFFIVSGKVSILDKKTKTHIIDLISDQYFGEISFFSDIVRQATVKSRDFSEMLVVKRDDFLTMAGKVSTSALQLFHQIKQQLQDNEKNFKILLIKCYICSRKGHIAKDCGQFSKIRGNLKKVYKELYNKSVASESSNTSNQKHSPIMVSLASSSDQQNPQFEINELNSQNDNQQVVIFNQHHSKHRQSFKNAARAQLKQLHSVESNVTFKQPRYHDTQFSNFVVLPRALQNEINKSDDEDEKIIHFPNFNNKNVFLVGESFDQAAPQNEKIQGFFGGLSQQKMSHESKKQAGMQLNSPPPGQQPAHDSLNNKQGDPYSPRMPVEEKINTLVFNTQVTPSDLTTPLSDSAFSQNLGLKSKVPTNQIITAEDLVILEDDNENFEDDQLISDDDSMVSYDHPTNNTGGYTPAAAAAATANGGEPANLKFVQQKRKVPTGPPKGGLNELSKFVGKNKRFGSKNFRRQEEMGGEKRDRQMKRVISIIKPQQVVKKTVVRKTFTTVIEEERTIDMNSKREKKRRESKQSGTRFTSERQGNFYAQFIHRNQKTDTAKIERNLSSSSSQVDNATPSPGQNKKKERKRSNHLGSIESDNDYQELISQRTSSEPNSKKKEVKEEFSEQVNTEIQTKDAFIRQNTMFKVKTKVVEETKQMQ